jgi:hypothetical protein
MAAPDVVEQPSDEDREWLRKAEAHILALFERRLGEANFFHDRADLALAQRAMDAKVITSADELEMQCVGVVLGNVFDALTEMKWAMVTNSYGRLLALHAPRIGFTLYPMQMIIKRVRSGQKFDVPSLYLSFVNDLALQPA